MSLSTWNRNTTCVWHCQVRSSVSRTGSFSTITSGGTTNTPAPAAAAAATPTTTKADCSIARGSRSKRASIAATEAATLARQALEASKTPQGAAVKGDGGIGGSLGSRIKGVSLSLCMLMCISLSLCNYPLLLPSLGNIRHQQKDCHSPSPQSFDSSDSPRNPISHIWHRLRGNRL